MINRKLIYITLITIIFAICGIYLISNTGGNDDLNNTSLKNYDDLILNMEENSSEVETSSEDEALDKAQDEVETTTEAETTTEHVWTKKEAKKLINFDAEYPFMIRINRARNFAIAYGVDKDGRYSVPYKAFVCSTGLNEGDTPTGVFTMSDKYTWRLMVDYSYAQYAIRISGPIMLHSVPYYHQSKDSLESEEYNKLGEPASLGCVRFNVKSIKWIYDNCPAGSTVVVYDAEDEIPPIKIPNVKKIDLEDSRAGWDPTDPDPDNPWKK